MCWVGPDCLWLIYNTQILADPSRSAIRLSYSLFSLSINKLSIYDRIIETQRQAHIFIIVNGVYNYLDCWLNCYLFSNLLTKLYTVIKYYIHCAQSANQFHLENILLNKADDYIDNNKSNGKYH